MSKDPMWIPKPPVLYGSDKLEIFQPYDPETPGSTSPPGSPSCPGSPSDSSSSGSVTIPSLLTSIRASPPVATSATVATQSTSNTTSNKNPLQTILKTLFGPKQTDSMVSSDGSSTTTTTTTATAKATTASTTSTVSAQMLPVFSQASGSIVDPIVQQYGHKSKVKQIEEEENDFDRPYDPEEEYDPAMRYGVVSPQNIEKMKASGPPLSGCVDDDVAYDPEDESIFKDIQTDVTKPPVQTVMLDSPSCPMPIKTQVVTPTSTSTLAHTSSLAAVPQNLPTGTVVVSAATLTEQQRMLEELNKQIEEQKRQLKEQEEALRQQREAVGMFMAHFSVSDSLMSPPQKSLPLSQLSCQQSGMQTESRPPESTDKASNLSEAMDSPNAESQTINPENTNAIPHLKNDTDTVIEQDETQENDKYSSAGEIEDSDVAYDPEDESLFNEIQEDVFQGSSIKTCDSSLSKAGHKGTPLNSYHSRKGRPSPKKRSHRERDRHRSPSRKSQRRSPSHSRRRRERERRRSERDRSRHRNRDQSERQGRHRKEHTTHRHSHGRRGSPSSSRQKDSVYVSQKQDKGPSPHIPEKPTHVSGQLETPLDPVVGQFVESNTSYTPVTIKNDPDGHQLKCNFFDITIPQQKSLDKDFAHGLLQNVKLEISEPPKELQKHSVSDHDDKGSGSSTQVDKLSQQETVLNSKIESTVPLREIDPPIRDSPESPDPDPRFVDPKNIERSESVTIEEMRDPETDISGSMPLVKIENKCLPIGSQASLSNIPWPTVEDPMSDVRSLGFRALDQNMIESDKQIEWECTGLNHPEILGQEGALSNPGKRTGIQGSDMRNSGQDIKGPGFRAPHIDLRERGITCPGTDRRSPGMPSTSPNTWGLKPLIQDLHERSQGKHGSYPGREMQNLEPNIKDPAILCLSRDRSVSDSRGSKSRDSTMYHPGLGTSKPNDSCLQKGLLGLTTEEQRKPENSDGRSGIMDIGGPQIQSRAQDIGRGRQQEDIGERIHTGNMTSTMKAVRDPSPDIRSAGSSFRGSEIIQSHDGSPVLEERGPQKRSFQSHGKDADLSRGCGGRERSLDSNASTGSKDKVLRASATRTDERLVPQRGLDVPMREPQPNINYESAGSNMSFGQDSSGPREDFKEPQSDIQIERSMHGPGMRESETMHELRRLDMRGVRFMGPGQDMGSMSGSVTKGDRSESHSRSPGRDVGEMGPNRWDEGMQGRNIQGPWGRRNEQMAREDRGPITNITNPDWRDTGPGGDQRSQNRDLGPHPNWSGPGSDIRDDWRGPDRCGSGPVRGGFVQDERRALQSDKKGPNMECQRLDRRGVGGLDFRESGTEMRCTNMEDLRQDRRGREGPDFMGPGPKRRGPDMEVPVHDRRGPEGPDFFGSGPERRHLHIEGRGPDRRTPVGPDNSGPGSERRGPVMEGLGSGMRGPGGPDFVGPVPERKGQVIGGPGPDMRGPGGPHFRGPGPETKNPLMAGPGPDMRGPTGPDFNEPWPERQGPDTVGPGPDMRGPTGPDFKGPWPERQGPDMVGPGLGKRRSGGPDFRGPGPERRNVFMEGPGPDRRGPGGPDFRGPGTENRGPAMEVPVPERRGIEAPDFSRPGPERKNQAMGGPGPDRRGPRGPDFQGPGPERRGPSMDCQAPNRKGPGGPDLSGPGCERRDPSVEGQGPHRMGLVDQNTGGLGPDRRGPYMVCSGPDFMGPGHDFMGPGPERTGLVMEGPGLHSREQGGLPFRGLGPESRHLNMEGPRPNRRVPGIIGQGPERPGSGMEGLGPDRIGQQGLEFMEPSLDGTRPCMEDPGPIRRGPRGPTLKRPGLQHSGPNIEGPGPDRRGPEGLDVRGPGSERRLADMEATGHSRSFSGSLQFSGPKPERRPPGLGGPESDRRGPHLRGVGPERTVMEGPGPNRKGPVGLDFRGPRCESRGPDIDTDRQEPGGPGFRNMELERRVPDLEGPGPDWRGSGGPAFRGSGIRQKSPNNENLRHGRRDDWGGADFAGSEPNQECPDIEYLGPERIGRNMRGPRPTRRNITGPRPDRRGMDTEEQWSDGKGAYMEARGNERECSGDEWKRHGIRDPGPIHEGPRDDWSGPGCSGPGPFQDDPDMCLRPGKGGPGNEWREPDRGGAGPNRKGPGSFFKRERDPDNRGQDHNIRGPGMRGPVSDMRGGPDMRNEWRQSDHMGNMRGPNMEGPGPHRGHPDLMNPCQNRSVCEMEGHDRRGPGNLDLRRPGLENRNSNIEGPGTDGRRSDLRVLGSERQGMHMESPGPGRQKFEQDFKRGRRGPDMRGLGSDQTNMNGPTPESIDIRHGPRRWDTNTGGPGSDRRGGPMMGPGLDARASELAMNDEMQGSDIRGLGYDSIGPDMRGSRPRQMGQITSDERRGPESRRLDMSAPPNFNRGAHQLTRFKSPNDPHPAPFNRPLARVPNSEGKSCPSFENLQDQQAVKPQRHRAALLPTPTEGLIRFPNRMINSPDVFSPKLKQIGYPKDREWNRGRPVSRERELVKGQRQEQEKSLAVKISTPVAASTGSGEEKKEDCNETNNKRNVEPS
ncbi:hypothetical protein PAMA_021512 [Pampus argenteus]